MPTSSLAAKADIIKKWTKEQLYSTEHWLSLLAFALITFFSFGNVFISLLGYLIFFVVTAISHVFNILVFAAITALITYLFPPVGAVLSVIFFISKISYIFENWRALLAGIIFYIYPFFLVSINSNLYYPSLEYILFITIFTTVIFNFLLVWLYHNKYSTKNALETMGAAPVFVFMLILPFVADEIGAFLDFDEFEEYKADFSDYNYDQFETDAVDFDTEAVDQNPGLHDVEGHWRETASGEYTYVEPHVRTNPDGIESNNLS